MHTAAPLGRQITRRAALGALTGALAAASPALGQEPAESAVELAAPAGAPAAGERDRACCEQFRIRDADQVWVLSSRHLCCPSGAAPQALAAQQFVNHAWRGASVESFLGFSDPLLATVFYLHGNRIDEGTARADALAVYFRLVGRFDHERPVRLVAYSWPSDQIRGPLRDVRAKAARADEEGPLFGRLLSALTPAMPVGIVGYSYGARVTTGALHHLGARGAAHPPLHAALWAAAVHHDWPLPGHHHGLALPQAERWLICVNPCDPVLQRYSAVEKCGDPVALGYAGLPPHGPLASEIGEFPVGHLVGKSHDMRSYLHSPQVACRTRDAVLWREVPAPA